MQGYVWVLFTRPTKGRELREKETKKTKRGWRASTTKKGAYGGVQAIVTQKEERRTPRFHPSKRASKTKSPEEETVLIINREKGGGGGKWVTEVRKTTLKGCHNSKLRDSKGPSLFGVSRVYTRSRVTCCAIVQKEKRIRGRMVAGKF